MYNPRIMNSIALMDNEFVVRPKVSRLPFLPVDEAREEEKELDSGVIWRSIYAFAGISLFTVAFVAYHYEAGSSKKAVVPADDARLVELVSSSDDVMSINNASIYFKDGSGVIIGQMVKMESDSSNVTLSSARGGAASSDAAVNHDLLAILSKY